MEQELSCEKARLSLPHTLACEDHYQSHRLTRLPLVNTSICLSCFANLFLSCVSYSKFWVWFLPESVSFFPGNRKKIHIPSLKSLVGRQDNLQLLLLGMC